MNEVETIPVVDDLQLFIDELIQFNVYFLKELNKARMLYYWTIGKMIVDFMSDKTHHDLYGAKIVHTCGISLKLPKSLIYAGMNYYELEPDFESSREKYENWTAVKLALAPPQEKEPHTCVTFKTVEICTECNKERK